MYIYVVRFVYYISLFFYFYVYCDHRFLPSFPTRRSSDLVESCGPERRSMSPLTFEVSRRLWWHVKHTAASPAFTTDRKSTRLNSSHLGISYAVFCLKKKITRY